MEDISDFVTGRRAYAATPYDRLFKPREEVYPVTDPEVASRKGRSRKRPLRKDWESVKDRIMHEAVLAKFTQHTGLRDILLGMGKAKIVEHTRKDAYRGDGGDGSGKNVLGQIFMRDREELRDGQEGGDPAQAGLRGAVEG